MKERIKNWLFRDKVFSHHWWVVSLLIYYLIKVIKKSCAEKLI
jgi:surface polysaccharide O-acyltransferase-like enzyme